MSKIKTIDIYCMSMQNVSGSTGFKMIQGNRWLGLDAGFKGKGQDYGG